jgi:hypothetical protein
VKTFDGLATGRPPNGTQAHDLSREQQFGRPAQVGATPFGDRPASKPCAGQNGIPASFGAQQEMNKPVNDEHEGTESVTHVLNHKCYRCLDWAPQPKMANGR